MKFKRFLSLILCLTLMFQFYIFKYHEVTAEASDFAMPSDAYLKSVIAPLLVSAGLVFRSQQALDDTVQKVQLRIIQGGLDSTVPRPPNDPKPPRTWKEVLTALATGYVVYDVATGLYKNVVSIGSDFFHFIKTWVDDNFNVGDNKILVLDGFTTISGVMAYGDLPYQHYPLKTFYVSPNKYLNYIFLDRNNVNQYFGFKLKENASYVELRVHSTSNWNRVIYQFVSFDSNGKEIPGGGLELGDKTYAASGYNYEISFGVFDKPYNEIFTNNNEYYVNGKDNIVDNPNFDWSNIFTGDKTLVLPVETSPLGLPSFTPDGLPVPELSPDYMVNVNPDVIPEQNPTGIKYSPDGSELPEPVSPTYPDDLPHVDIDNPNKRSLLLSKFPFCLPWDLKNLFSLFLAPAEAPRFEIDFIPPAFKSKVGIEGSTQFVLDMSDFPLVGKMSRFFSFLSACLGLILVSRRIMNS